MSERRPLWTGGTSPVKRHSERQQASEERDVPQPASNMVQGTQPDLVAQS